jgi:hypothetical protein
MVRPCRAGIEGTLMTAHGTTLVEVAQQSYKANDARSHDGPMN